MENINLAYDNYDPNGDTRIMQAFVPVEQKEFIRELSRSTGRSVSQLAQFAIHRYWCEYIAAYADTPYKPKQKYSGPMALLSVSFRTNKTRECARFLADINLCEKSELIRRILGDWRARRIAVDIFDDALLEKPILSDSEWLAIRREIDRRSEEHLREWRSRPAHLR